MTAPGIEPGKAERHLTSRSRFFFKRKQSSVLLFCAVTFHLCDSPVAGSFTSGHVHLVRLDVRQLVSLIRPQGPQPLAGVAVRPLDKAVLLMRSLGIAADPMPQRSLIARGFNLTLIFLRRKILSNCLTKLIYLNYLQSISNFNIKMFPFHINIH